MNSHKGGLGKLKMCPSLKAAAKDHYVDIATGDVTTHAGTDGSSYKDRIERYAKWGGAIYESIVYKRELPKVASESSPGK